MAAQLRINVCRFPAKIAHRPNPTVIKPIGHVDQFDGWESSIDRYATEVMIIASKDAVKAHVYGQEILSNRRVVMNEKLICDFPKLKEIVSGILNRNNKTVVHATSAVKADTSQERPAFSRKKCRLTKINGTRIKRIIGNKINIGSGVFCCLA
jgi:hypothetical protein